MIKFLRMPVGLGVIIMGIMSAPAVCAAGAAGQVGVDAIEILNPAEIIPPQDYPVISWRNGEEGNVTVKLKVRADGVMQDCQVTVSSGYKALDDQTCTSIRLHGRFRALSQPNEPGGLYSATTRVSWVMPTGGPRALFLGVTLTGSSPAMNDRLRCTFSDGRVLFVTKGESCVLDVPRQTISEAGTSRSVDIVDYYLDLYKRDRNPIYGFNVAFILATYQYAESLDYLAKSSDDGLGLSSLGMCATYGSPRNYFRDIYDPKEAVRRCLLADKQGLSLGVILAQQLLIQHPEAASNEHLQYIKDHPAAVPMYTSRPTLTIPGNDLIRSKDYPKDALKQKIQGRTVALFKVNEQGRVGDCLIIQSSLSFSMDDTVCRRIHEAAIYSPATMLGQPTSSWTSQAVDWQIGKGGNGLGGTIFGALVGALIGHAIP